MKNNFKTYTTYFHDGLLLAIKHIGNDIGLAMESAEITKNDKDFDNKIVLSNTRRITGILHLQAVTNIKESGKVISNIEMKYDDASILDFKLNTNMTELELNLLWSSYKSKVEEYSFYKLTSNKIYWENSPHFNLSVY